MSSSKLHKQIRRAYNRKHHSISRISVETGLPPHVIRRIIEEVPKNRGYGVLDNLIEGFLLLLILCVIAFSYYGIPYLILHVWLKQPLPGPFPGGMHHG
jgi:hypothetical protein